jgi:hypothetical protein
MSRKIVEKVLSVIGTGTLVACVTFKLQDYALKQQLENYGLRKKLISDSNQDIRDRAIEINHYSCWGFGEYVQDVYKREIGFLDEFREAGYHYINYEKDIPSLMARIFTVPILPFTIGACIRQEIVNHRLQKLLCARNNEILDEIASSWEF